MPEFALILIIVGLIVLAVIMKNAGNSKTVTPPDPEPTPVPRDDPKPDPGPLKPFDPELDGTNWRCPYCETLNQNTYNRCNACGKSKY